METPGTYEVAKLPDIVTDDLMVFDGMTLALHQNLTLPQAGAILERLYQARDWSQFHIGDLLNHCNAKFGEDFAQIVDAEKYQPKTLQRFAYIADRVPPDNRRQALSYSIHVEVAHLDPESQKGWLQMAIDEGWTVDEMREAMGKKKPKKEKEPKIIHFPCPHCRKDVEVSEDDFK